MTARKGYNGVHAAVKFKRGVRPRHNVSDGILGELQHHSVLLRWRSSLWKLVWIQLLIYTMIYMSISMIYRFALTDDQAKIFENIVKWTRVNSQQLPLTFLLGFYVSLVVKRWWEQYIKLPWPDEVASYLKVSITKDDEKDSSEVDSQTIRQTIMRYCLLSYVLCLRRISSLVRHHYKDMDQIVETGLARADEMARIGEEEEEDLQRHGGSNWWLPIKWSLDIIKKHQGRFANPPAYTNLVARICAFRKGLTDVASYGHVTIPLVYTQVVHLVVYIHFAVRLIGDQWIIWRKPGDEEVDLYYPIFLTFKFLFFFGWLNVAQTLYNPYGCDDEDFELIDLINRHVKVSAAIVDSGDDYPELKKDVFLKKTGTVSDEAEFVIDEKESSNWKKSSFACRTESRDMGQ